MVDTIAIASGKGGVGKTSLAVNCAVKLSLDNKRVALLDADFGLANAHIMLDQKVSASISDLLDGTCQIDQVIHDTPSGLKLIPGGSGVLELMNIDSKKRWEVIKSLDHLENDIDFLFVDTPAGASDSSVEFAAACDKIIIVLVGEPTSFMDAYAFIKALNLEKNLERVSIVVNMAKGLDDAKSSFNSFQKIVAQFLEIELSFLGWLPSSQVISNSILSRKPFVLNSKVNKHLNAQLAEIVSNINNAHPCKTNSIRFFDK
jgi:flagellar biosynthesis protein FlhG